MKHEYYKVIEALTMPIVGYLITKKNREERTRKNGQEILKKLVIYTSFIYILWQLSSCVPFVQQSHHCLLLSSPNVPGIESLLLLSSPTKFSFLLVIIFVMLFVQLLYNIICPLSHSLSFFFIFSFLLGYYLLSNFLHLYHHPWRN